jgi:hypothetical protein
VVHECRSNADQRLISLGTRIFCPKLVMFLSSSIDMDQFC